MADTNVPSELTKPVPDERVAAFLREAGKDQVFVSVVTVGEIDTGIAELTEDKRREELRRWLDEVMRPWFTGRILPITETIAQRWGTLTADRPGKAAHNGGRVNCRNGPRARVDIGHAQWTSKAQDLLYSILGTRNRG
jgi:toxin FitB